MAWFPLRPSRPSRENFSRRAFTLIELLVVIAIIAILASLLLPGITLAAGSGRKSLPPPPPPFGYILSTMKPVPPPRNVAVRPMEQLAPARRRRGRRRACWTALRGAKRGFQRRLTAPQPAGNPAATAGDPDGALDLVRDRLPGATGLRGGPKHGRDPRRPLGLGVPLQPERHPAGGFANGTRGATTLFSISFLRLLIHGATFGAFLYLAQADDKPSEPTVELRVFKDFLTNRPVIASLEYTARPLLSRDLLDAHAPGMKAPPTNETSRIRGQWQPGQYHISLPPADRGKPATLFFGRDLEVLWQISGGIVTIFTNDLSIAPTVEASMQPFLDVLNLGIPNVVEGSLAWDGLRLSGLSQTSNVLTAELLLDHLGHPATLECAVAGYPWRYRVAYKYGIKSLEPPLPETIQLSVILSNGVHSLSESRILSLKTNSGLLPEALYAPYRATNYATSPLILVSNGVAYARIGANEWVKVRAPSPWAAARMPVFVITLLLAMVALWWTRERLKISSP